MQISIAISQKLLTFENEITSPLKLICHSLFVVTQMGWMKTDEPSAMQFEKKFIIPRKRYTTDYISRIIECNHPIHSHEETLPPELISSQRGAIGERLNKCLPGLSRRSADKAITQQRVTVNGIIGKVGDRVAPGDIIKLDGKVQKWESWANAKIKEIDSELEKQTFIYLKYWKPVGVTCTNNVRDETNILKAGNFNLFPQRLFTVGRLDKDSTGLILLTSDGRVNNALLNRRSQKEKVYEVLLNRDITDEQIGKLCSGVVITTMIHRSSISQPITAKTLPCIVRRIAANNVDRKEDVSKRILEITLVEGRNRQIRLMIESIGLKVISLHRKSFAGIGLSGIQPGSWMALNEKELDIIRSAIQ